MRTAILVGLVTLAFSVLFVLHRGPAGAELECSVDNPTFFSADANNDGLLDVSDPILVLNYLFSGGGAPYCLAEVEDFSMRLASLEERAMDEDARRAIAGVYAAEFTIPPSGFTGKNVVWIDADGSFGMQRGRTAIDTSEDLRASGAWQWKDADTIVGTAYAVARADLQGQPVGANYHTVTRNCFTFSPDRRTASWGQTWSRYAYDVDLLDPSSPVIDGGTFLSGTLRRVDPAGPCE